MDEDKLAEMSMGLIINGGNARATAIEAIRAARDGDFEKAENLIKESDAALTEAHNVQTDMLQKEAKGEHMQVYLLMVHAQDHLMNAITVRDLATEIIELNKKINIQ